MKAKMNVPYDDGEFKLKADDDVPAKLAAKLVKVGLARKYKPRKPILDDDAPVGNASGD